MITIIPAIDIIGGECVRLTQGDYGTKKTYSADVLSVAKGYEDIGIKRLHMVDLDGAKESFPRNLLTLEKVAAGTSLDIQYGGGIKSAEALKAVFDSGAKRAICGSIAVTDPDAFTRWLGQFGPERIILGADIRNGYVATHGWLEGSTMTAEQLIEKFAQHGMSQVICTDISRDGMLDGPSFDLYERLQGEFPSIDITVSGGISSMDDILRLDAMKMRSVIVGKAIYEGHITLERLKECLQNE